MIKSAITHDRLQQECYMWMHNSYPALRKLFWGVFNETKPFPGESKESFRIRINRLKGIGLVPGVFDFHFFYKWVLHCFDFKVDNDHLSDDQVKFAAQVEHQGGKCYEIRSLQQFQTIITDILNTKEHND